MHIKHTPTSKILAIITSLAMLAIVTWFINTRYSFTAWKIVGALGFAGLNFIAFYLVHRARKSDHPNEESEILGLLSIRTVIYLVVLLVIGATPNIFSMFEEVLRHAWPLLLGSMIYLLTVSIYMYFVLPDADDGQHSLGPNNQVEQ